MKQNHISILLFSVFEIIAVLFWLWRDNLFYLFNFSYIGLCLSIGIYFYAKKKRYARIVVQFAVGSYMLLYLGGFCHENMQIEGFWHYLFQGIFAAATLHYLIAKILGPLLFGRGWCGYACWTGMLLDLLPYQTPLHPRRKHLTKLRYLMFIASLVFVAVLHLYHIPQTEQIITRSFLVGNLFYYMAGITMAMQMQDNRAFCKYLCPITIFLKPASYFSLMRVKIDKHKCISCNKCHQVCPMDVDMTSNERSRKNATECILCLRCVDACPKDALHL